MRYETDIDVFFVYIWFVLYWMEFEFNQFKKVLDKVGQSEYRNITQYTSKIKL